MSTAQARLIFFGLWERMIIAPDHRRVCPVGEELLGRHIDASNAVFRAAVDRCTYVALYKGRDFSPTVVLEAMLMQPPVAFVSALSVARAQPNRWKNVMCE